MIRMARDFDLPAIESIARSRFVRPYSLFGVPENLAHYQPGYPRISPEGSIYALVSSRRDVIDGYAFIQVRRDGDTYICEIAVSHSGVGIGSRILKAIAKYSLLAGSNRLTANVMECHREPDVDWRDPVPFYLKRGFQIVTDELGYAIGAATRSPHDIWLVADVRSAIAKCISTASQAKELRQLACPEVLTCKL